MKDKQQQLLPTYPHSTFVSNYMKRFSTQPLRVNFAKNSHKVLAGFIDMALLGAFFYVTGLHWGFWLVTALSYLTLTEYSRLHASLGEYVLGIQIRHRTGKPAALRHILWRNITYVLTLGLSSLSSLFSRKGRGLHDQVGHTISLEVDSKKKKTTLL